MMQKKSRRTGMRGFCYILLLTGVLLCSCMTAEASGEQKTEKPELELLEELDFSRIDAVIDAGTGGEGISFRSLVRMLIRGEEIDKKQLWESGKSILFRELRESKTYMIQILLVAAAFAFLYNFANVFEQKAVTDVSFYIVYMILVVLLMKSFLLMNEVLVGTLHTMLDFSKALVPAFCLTMMVSTGTLTAMGVYQLTLFVIGIIEVVLLYGVVPAVHIYLVLELLNHLTNGEMISRMTELLKGGVEWVLKFLFSLVIGINVVQGLLNPVIDTFRTSALARTASMLPGFGNSVNAVAEIMVGSGMIIKNGVGIAGILAVLALCAVPAIKVGAMILMYKISAAVIQPVTDKRISGCVNGMGEGARLFGKIMMTAMVMLLLTIALVVAATTWNR